MPTATGSGPRRLRSSRDITRTMSSRRCSEGVVRLHAHDRGDGAPARVAVIASRRVGRAVDRNRAKRLLRESARALSWSNGHDIVLVARSRAAGSSFQAVHADVTACAHRLRLLEAA